MSNRVTAAEVTAVKQHLASFSGFAADIAVLERLETEKRAEDARDVRVATAPVANNEGEDDNA